MRSPVFVVCQGRTGGTMFSDILVRLQGTRYLIEPLHPRLPRNVQEQRKRTAEVLRHDGILDYPCRGYGVYPFREIVAMHATQHAKDTTVRKWFRYLVDGAHVAKKVPVFKVCRLFGRLHLLREEYPDAAIIHLWRDLASQRASYQRVGFPADYFGDCSGYGLAPDKYREAWQAAQDEARTIADVSISYQTLCSMPEATLRHVFTEGMDIRADVANLYAEELAPLVRRTAV